MVRGRSDELRARRVVQVSTLAQLTQQVRRVPRPPRLAEHLAQDRHDLVDDLGRRSLGRLGRPTIGSDTLGSADRVGEVEQRRQRGGGHTGQQLGASPGAEQSLERGQALDVASQRELVQERPTHPFAGDEVGADHVRGVDDARLRPEHPGQHLGGVAVVAVDRRIRTRRRLEHRPGAEGIQVRTGPLRQRRECQRSGDGVPATQQGPELCHVVHTDHGHRMTDRAPFVNPAGDIAHARPAW